MRCIRILPDTCARTLWPFSITTRNIALGSGSTTVPCASIASSLLMLLRFRLSAASWTDAQCEIRAEMQTVLRTRWLSRPGRAVRQEGVDARERITYSRLHARGVTL